MQPPSVCKSCKVADLLRVDPLRVNVLEIDICGAGHRDISFFCIRMVTVRYKNIPEQYGSVLMIGLLHSKSIASSAG